MYRKLYEGTALEGRMYRKLHDKMALEGRMYRAGRVGGQGAPKSWHATSTRDEFGYQEKRVVP